ncbi:hypothetical protein BX600DRAFT_462208 [Xylariales sp. PMI_506]|nr:hypothetical protein BX600DRAFT_462208 [Xylariales sp. PMI_506]
MNYLFMVSICFFFFFSLPSFTAQMVRRRKQIINPAPNRCARSCYLSNRDFHTSVSAKGKYCGPRSRKAGAKTGDARRRYVEKDRGSSDGAPGVWHRGTVSG